MALIDGAAEITDETMPVINGNDEEAQFEAEYGDENEDLELDGTGIFQKYSKEEIEAAKNED